MFKKAFFRIIDIFLNRKQLVRLSQAMLNRALGNNNGDMATNGEIYLMRQVLGLQREERRRFIAFDVGANVGEWSISLLEIAEELGGYVYCFEPAPVAFSKLQAAFKSHQLQGKAFAISTALGNSDGTMELYIKTESSGINSLYNRRLEGLGITYEKSETVRVTTVDAYCRENNISHIDFLKVDVEGHELAVMQGSTEMLKKQAIDYIQFEYGGCWIDSRTLFLDMYDLLTSFGYIIGKIMPNGIEFYDKYDQRLETFQMANFLACKPDYAVRLKRVSPPLL